MCATRDKQSGIERVRSFQFASLDDCRRQFAKHIGAPDVEWDPEYEFESANGTGQTANNATKPTELAVPKNDRSEYDALESEREPDLEPNDRSEWDDLDSEWEPDLEPNDRSEYDGADGCE